MLKIGINSAPRITTPEKTETQETRQQNVQEQIAPAQTKPDSAANSSIRSESMFTTTAIRAQLTQQLAQNKSIKSNPESFENMRIADRQAALTGPRADRQINNHPSYVKPFSKEDAGKKAFLPKTLNTGDGDDTVDIQQSSDGRVHVNVNGKEAWSGTAKQFQALTIHTGAGNDTVNIHSMDYLVGATVETGDGNDVVNNQSSLASIDTGAGNDTVTSNGDNNRIHTGDGNDIVETSGDNNEIQTGDGADWVRLNSERFTDANGIDSYSGYANSVDTGAGNDSVLVDGPLGAAINTGDGEDYVENKGEGSNIQTGDGNDWVENSGDYSKIATGGGDDRINQTSGEGTTINGGEGYDHVFIRQNQSQPDTPGYWMTDNNGEKSWVRGEEHNVAPITVETDGSDVVYNSDGSKVVVDGENE